MKKILITSIFIISFGYPINVTSGGLLSKNQIGMDVKHYNINLKVETKRIPLASTGSRRVVTRAAAVLSLLGRKVSRMCATLHPRVHSRAPSRAPTCAEDEVDGEDPGPSRRGSTSKPGSVAL